MGLRNIIAGTFVLVALGGETLLGVGLVGGCLMYSYIDYRKENKKKEELDRQYFIEDFFSNPQYLLPIMPIKSNSISSTIFNTNLEVSKLESLIQSRKQSNYQKLTLEYIPIKIRE